MALACKKRREKLWKTTIFTKANRSSLRFTEYRNNCLPTADMPGFQWRQKFCMGLCSTEWACRFATTGSMIITEFTYILRLRKLPNIYLSIGKDKGVKLLKELDGILIERKKQGLGKPVMIYVLNFTDSQNSIQSVDNSAEVCTSENPTLIILILIIRIWIKLIYLLPHAFRLLHWREKEKNNFRRYCCYLRVTICVKNSMSILWV